MIGTGSWRGRVEQARFPLTSPPVLSYLAPIMAVCFFCHQDLRLTGKVSFSELCPHCGMDAHVCKNCAHYDPGRANNCREPMAEKVRDVEARNHCEYFVLAAGGPAGGNEAARARAALEKLFKKQ
ncbi:MAG: hypothetical protein AB1896_01970 [Thermodesulfobacteriota bacterium]